jgi:hypothetical protein
MSQLSEDQLDEIVDRERLRDLPPLNDWRAIAARAREEGLLRESEMGRIWGSAQPWLQAAAAVLILVGGIAIGRTTVGLPSAVANVATTQPVSPGSGSPSAFTPASNNGTSTAFASVEEASTALNRALTDYQRASSFLAANNASAGTRDSLAIYSARAEALDKIVNATERALQTAPHDPVINQYYLATMGARVATEQMVARPVALKGF